MLTDHGYAAYAVGKWHLTPDEDLHMGARRDRWPLAGDQLYVDLDLSHENLPVGTRLAIGTAELEVTAAPHTGCKKFASRFGLEALRVEVAVRQELAACEANGP